MPDITDTISGLVADTIDAPAATVTPSDTFSALTNWTSLAALALLTRVEEVFGVKLDLRAYFAVTDVAGLAALVDAELAGG